MTTTQLYKLRMRCKNFAPIILVMMAITTMIALVPTVSSGGKQLRSLGDVVLEFQESEMPARPKAEQHGSLEEHDSGIRERRELESVFNCTSNEVTLFLRKRSWVAEQFSLALEACEFTWGNPVACLFHHFPKGKFAFGPRCRQCVSTLWNVDFFSCVDACYMMDMCAPNRPPACGYPAQCKTREVESLQPVIPPWVAQIITDCANNWEICVVVGFLLLLIVSSSIIACCQHSEPTPLELAAQDIGIMLTENNELIVGETLERTFLASREETLWSLEDILAAGPPMPPRPGVQGRGFVPTRYAKAVAAEARASLCFGFSTQINNATHRLAQQKCWQILQDAVQRSGLRKAHALAILPMATALTLVPSRLELEARAVLATGAATAVRRLSTAALYHEYGGFLISLVARCRQETTSVLAHEGARVIRGRIRREKNTHTLCLSGLSPSENQYTSAKNTVVNAWCALMERVYYHYPSGNPADAARPYIPVPGWCFRGLHSFTLAMRELSPSSTPVALRDYPERYYTGRRLRVYQRARDLIEVRGSENKDAELISFIKVEKLAYGTKRIVPRLIQPRKPVYNVCVGRFLRPIEPVIYAMIADLFSCGRSRRVVCAKGLNCFELGELISENWNEFLTPVAVGIDAHRFDQHVCKEMLKWEHSIYTMFFHGADRLELSRLLRKQLENRGRIFCDDGEIHYSVSGSRMTGDMNTAVGNCLICCAIIYAWLLPRGLLPLVRIVDNGDDMIIITDERHRQVVMDGLAAWFHDFGFEIKVEAPVWIKEKVVFCQCQPVYDGERWRMVRSIPTSLCKDSVILQSGADANQQDLYIQGVGVAGLALASGLPVIQEFYSAMIRPSFDSALPKRKPGTVLEVGNLNPLGLAETGFYHLAKGCESRWRPVTWQARASFGLAFDMSPAVQLELETYYKSLRKQLSRRVQALEFVPL